MSYDPNNPLSRVGHTVPEDPAKPTQEEMARYGATLFAWFRGEAYAPGIEEYLKARHEAITQIVEEQSRGTDLSSLS